VTGPRRVAALDVGTNTVRLLVADLHGRQLTPLRYALRITRLGGGATPAGLADDAVARTVAAVTDFAALARSEGAAVLTAVATAAARDAPNGDALVRQARSAAGVHLAVISGDDEARLTLDGVAWGLARLPLGLPERFALIDIGGGSTEVLVAEPRCGGWATHGGSAPIGTVRLAERFLAHDPPAMAEMDAMGAEIEGQIHRHLGAAVAAARREPALALAGTAGSITTLAALDLGLAAYDRARVNGYGLTRERLAAWLARLVPIPASARLRFPGLQPGREDLIVPGIAILLALLAALGRNSLIVVDAGLLEGLALASGGRDWSQEGVLDRITSPLPPS
jgi:exopolyphosphatase/guanosine-5'-triphosphate,3'-diphosphate pyrophosphatase